MPFRPPANTTYTETDTAFYFCDFDLDPMTLIYEPDLDILKIYLRCVSKMKFIGQRFQRSEPGQDRQTYYYAAFALAGGKYEY